jgi:hypothetical protein
LRALAGAPSLSSPLYSTFSHFSLFLGRSAPEIAGGVAAFAALRAKMTSSPPKSAALWHERLSP